MVEEAVRARDETLVAQREALRHVLGLALQGFVEILEDRNLAALSGEIVGL